MLQQRELKNLAQKLGVSPDSLYKLIDFESSWNPYAKNPRSGAMGLIQFTNTTSKGMGYRSAWDLVSKYPSIEAQLKYPVYTYLEKYKPFRNQQSLFLSVFYPKARNWPSNKLFPQVVRKYNPGINTPADYVSKVLKKSNLTIVSPSSILIGIAILYLLLTRKGGIYARSKKTSA